MVMGKDGHKLSKRLGSTSVREFRTQGYLPEALLNCIALVGWSYDGSRELFTLKELEELFDIEKLNKSPAVFDYQKLEWFNGMYIRAKSPAELARPDRPVHEGGRVFPAMTGRCSKGVAGLVQERVKLLSEVPAMVRFIFEEPTAPAAGGPPAEEERSRPAASPPCGGWRRCCRSWAGRAEETEARLRALAEELGMKLGDMLMPLRVAVTGSRVSPPLVESIRVMGWRRRAGAHRAGNCES